MDWPDLALASLVVLGGMATSWIWGFNVGITHGRELERDDTAARAERQRRL